MTSFAALMALSATQTQRSEAAVQSQLAERKRREAEKRKQLEEQERKEREMEGKLRQRALEEAARAKEREARFEAERRAKEAALRRKEEEQRNALLYGKKGGGGRAEYPTAGGAARDELRRRRAPEDDDDEGGGGALTREEKRRMRLQRELNYGAGSSKRPAAGYRKAGRRLAGGAVDMDDTAMGRGGAATAGSYRSVKERLIHEPPGLIKLNVHKRDTRTIDEIVADRARERAKVLDGDQAKSFDNWFGKTKPKAASIPPPSAPSSIFSSRSPSPAPPAHSDASKAASRASKSQSRTPPVVPQPQPAPKSALSSMSFSKKDATPAPKGSGVVVKSLGGRPAPAATKPSTNGKAPARAGPPTSKSGGAGPSKAPARTAGTRPGAPALGKKRARSPSRSPTPPPTKRRSAPPGGGAPSISEEIWKLFGKNRGAYVGRDVYSDDEDMEAGAQDLESEELYSAKVARREDELALEEEKRREDEKRRRKKEKEMRDRRGY